MLRGEAARAPHLYVGHHFKEEDAMLAVVMKVLLVGIVLVAGIFFLASGLGADIPFVKYKEIEAYGVPVGVILLAVGSVMAIFWKVSTSTTTESQRTETTSSSDGTTTTTTTSTTKTTITTLAKPPH